MSGYIETLEAIKRFYEKKGWYPSMEELSIEAKKHKNTVYGHVRDLEAEELLKRNNKGRIISLPNNSHGKQSNTT